jgi:hypothetical protein
LWSYYFIICGWIIDIGRGHQNEIKTLSPDAKKIGCYLFERGQALPARKLKVSHLLRRVFRSEGPHQCDAKYLA